jgi:predicted alpha/beta-hydrolase family hydrolase
MRVYARRTPEPQMKVDGLVLTPGASVGREHSNLVAIEEALTPAGVRTERVDFPYRVEGRQNPDSPQVLVATVVEAASSLAESLAVPPERIAIGGRSMGGRISSMAVAGGLGAAALVMVSYPLHLPARPEHLLAEHFGQISVPCLFVSGTRDAFGTPEELEAAGAAIAGPVTYHWIEGGDHSLRQQGNEVATTVRDWLTGL